MESNSYLAIIGDIVKSKTLTNREQVQEKLKEMLNKINNRYSQVIASKFLITIGDEFQGLLKPTDQLFEIINDIADAMEPVQIRFGVGHGTISTIFNEYALGMDGPAFHQARYAINKAHKYKSYVILFQSETPEESDLAIQTVLSLLSQIRLLWSLKQKCIIRCLKAGLTQEQIALELQISQSAVSQSIKNARIIAIQEAELNIQNLLAKRFK